MITLDAKAVEVRCQDLRLRKVYYAYYDSEFGTPHSMIRLQGKYLERLGFFVGDTIELHLEFGKITITKTTKSTPQNDNLSAQSGPPRLHGKTKSVTKNGMRT